MSVTLAPRPVFFYLLHKNLLHPKLQRFSSKNFINLCFTDSCSTINWVSFLRGHKSLCAHRCSKGTPNVKLLLRVVPSRERMQNPFLTQKTRVHVTSVLSEGLLAPGRLSDTCILSQYREPHFMEGGTCALQRASMQLHLIRTSFAPQRSNDALLSTWESVTRITLTRLCSA